MACPSAGVGRATIWAWGLYFSKPVGRIMGLLLRDKHLLCKTRYQGHMITPLMHQRCLEVDRIQNWSPAIDVRAGGWGRLNNASAAILLAPFSNLISKSNLPNYSSQRDI